MYHYKTEAEVKKYRNYCSEILEKLRDELYNYEINTQFILVGSGARNMVMANGDGPFDLDYNLLILEMPEQYRRNLRKLKNLIMNEINIIVNDTWFSNSKDSTSVITALLHDEDGVKFKFDLAIIAQNSNGNYCRLIHLKNHIPERYLWNEVPNSKMIKQKVDIIKSKHQWEKVRETYKEIKNRYLVQRDYNHPSFICYVEAVNEVYYNLVR